MPITSALRLNMTSSRNDPREEAKRYQTAIDMADYVDKNGFTVVSVEEHHCADNGWLPSPLTMAGLVAGRTQNVTVNVTALLITLYDPVRLAEDIAVLDLASNGRFNFVAGLGYRPIEYHAMDKCWEDRGKLMDHCIDTLLKAWSGEPFEYKGKTIKVTPTPLTQPHPFFFIGGMSKAAARRAAKFGLPFYPPMRMDELEQYYHEELKKFGNKGFVFYPDDENSMIFIDEDPEKAWQELGPCFLKEAQEYSHWKEDGVPRPSEQLSDSVAELRTHKRYEILTPQECTDRFKGSTKNTAVVMHPLAGGVPIDRAWQSLELYVNKVMPNLGR